MPRPGALGLRLGIAFTVGVVVLSAAVASDQGIGAQSAKSRVIDRTIRCPISLQAGVRELHVSAQAGVRDQADPKKWFALPQVSLYSGPIPATSVGLRAGRPEPSPVADSRRWTFWIGDAACRTASARVALSQKGLGGGAASQLLERFECVVPRRILIRMRAEFRSPVSLQGRGFTAAPLTSGYLAVRSDAGKPIVYAEVFEFGKARLLAGDCVRD